MNASCTWRCWSVTRWWPASVNMCLKQVEVQSQPVANLPGPQMGYLTKYGSCQTVCSYVRRDSPKKKNLASWNIAKNYKFKNKQQFLFFIYQTKIYSLLRSPSMLTWTCQVPCWLMRVCNMPTISNIRCKHPSSYTSPHLVLVFKLFINFCFQSILKTATDSCQIEWQIHRNARDSAHAACVAQQCLHTNCLQTIQNKQWPPNCPNVKPQQISWLGSDAQSFLEIFIQNQKQFLNKKSHWRRYGKYSAEQSCPEF